MLYWGKFLSGLVSLLNFIARRSERQEHRQQGRDEAGAEQQGKNIDAIKDGKAVDDSVDGMSDSAVDGELSGWVDEAKTGDKAGR